MPDQSPNLTSSNKNWKGYLYEFLMLFLAVTLGFFVENQRESFSDRDQEREYMKSMVEDLKSDTLAFGANLRARQERERMMDSLVYFIRTDKHQDHGNEVYYYARCISPPLNAFNNDRTIEQLKSSGSLRLIRNLKVSNGIMAYDQLVHEWRSNQGDEVELRSEYRIIAQHIFDGNVFYDMQQGDKLIKPSNNPSLFLKDPQKINELVIALQYLKKSNTTQIGRIRELTEQAGVLIGLIETEYE